MAGPALTVAGTGEEPVDPLLVGEVQVARGEAGQVEGQAAGEEARVRGFSSGQRLEGSLAQRREGPAVQLQLTLGPQVFLEEPGVLRPAELVERR